MGKALIMLAVHTAGFRTLLWGSLGEPFAFLIYSRVTLYVLLALCMQHFISYNRQFWLVDSVWPSQLIYIYT